MEIGDLTLLLVQSALVVAALWYSWETRRMRIQNLHEIHLLANQGRLALAPFLVPGASTKAELLKNIEASTEPDEATRLDHARQVNESDVRYIVRVDNPTDKTGCHLQPYIFDPLTKSFLIPDHGKEWIRPRESESFQVSGPNCTRKKIEEDLESEYGNIAQNLFSELDMPEDSGYVVLFFRDIEGTLYASKRPFRIVEDATVHSASRLSCASGRMS